MAKDTVAPVAVRYFPRGNCGPRHQPERDLILELLRAVWTDREHQTIDDVVHRMREEYGIAIGHTSVQRNRPDHIAPIRFNRYARRRAEMIVEAWASGDCKTAAEVRLWVAARYSVAVCYRLVARHRPPNILVPRDGRSPRGADDPFILPPAADARRVDLERAPIPRAIPVPRPRPKDPSLIEIAAAAAEIRRIHLAKMVAKPGGGKDRRWDLDQREGAD